MKIRNTSHYRNLYFLLEYKKGKEERQDKEVASSNKFFTVSTTFRWPKYTFVVYVCDVWYTQLIFFGFLLHIKLIFCPSVKKKRQHVETFYFFCHFCHFVTFHTGADRPVPFSALWWKIVFSWYDDGWWVCLVSMCCCSLSMLHNCWCSKIAVGTSLSFRIPFTYF